MTPPSGFSTLTPIPSSNELPPITVPTFTARTPENTPLTNHASTSANPDPMISLAFVEANYEILESLLRERREQIRNKDLRTELEYFSEDYDEEREMEPRPICIRETNPVLYTRSSRTRRQKERMVDFEEVPNRDGGRIKRNSEGARPSGRGRIKGQKPRNESSSAFSSSLRKERKWSIVAIVSNLHAINIGGNLPPNDTHLSHNAQPFIPSNLQPSNGLMPTHVNLYSQPYMGVTIGQSLNYPPRAQNGNPSFGGTSVQYPQGGYVLQAPISNSVSPYNGFIYPVVTPSNNYSFYTQPMCTQPNMSAYPNPGSAGLFADLTGCVTPFVCWIENYPLPDSLKMSSHVGSYNEKGDPDNYLHIFEGAIPREVATNGAPNDRREGFNRSRKNPSWDNNKGQKNRDRNRRSHDMTKYFHFYEDHGHDTNDFCELRHQIEEAVKSAQLSHLVKGIKKGKAKTLDTQWGEWKKGDKVTAPAEAPILMISRRDHTTKRKSLEELILGLRKSHSLLLQGQEKGQKTIREVSLEDIKGILSCTDAKERIIINRKYPEQTVIIGKQLLANFKERLLPSNTNGRRRQRQNNLFCKRRNILLPKDAFPFEERQSYLPETGGQGPFLGHLSTKQGIRANPSKVKAVTDLELPRTLKDVHSLNGEVLVMYLRASAESISNVLLTEREERQVPIYFVSRVLQGAELNYPALEKLILALVHAARRLQRIADSMRNGNQKHGHLRRLSVNGQLNKGTLQSQAAYVQTISLKGEGNIKGFDTYKIKHILRNQNKKADALSKLALMTFKHLTKDVLVEADNIVKENTKAPTDLTRNLAQCLTYGLKAIILSAKSLALEGKGYATKENKEGEEREVASIEEAYYQNKLRMHHNINSNCSTFKLGDFVLFSLSSTDS
ncbi:reverse transcriptase domain-containing protein [Tanacetum coccineum]